MANINNFFLHIFKILFFAVREVIQSFLINSFDEILEFKNHHVNILCDTSNLARDRFSGAPIYQCFQINNKITTIITT